MQRLHCLRSSGRRFAATQASKPTLDPKATPVEGPEQGLSINADCPGYWLTNDISYQWR